MNNNSYSAISLPIPSTYHHLNDPLQRYGSGDDLDIFGIVVSRSSDTYTMLYRHFINTDAFTLCMNSVSKWWYNDGLLVMTMTLFGFIAVILYTLQNQYKFSGAKAILMTCVGICLSSPWLRRVFDKDPLEILWPMVQAIIVCSYFVLELYYTMGSVTVDDYILANICFYIDLLYPMRCLHNLCELTDDVEVFPDILRPGPDS
ncbi:hypothetical protein BCR43DRAFT_444491 [Syncephalastrum racemosum]|uniref:Uncharacterized protein n=1 Tax=Syncephalastrum racemosum TaxID=13706 RepID=A0A1X2H3L0_SYNRA|nr:hypothetical protein BCR43DRAFT_444491 [Syncephalastrum racemosum]